jgi:hypothetical protein
MKILKRIFITLVIIQVVILLFAILYPILSKTKHPIDRWDSEEPYMQVYFCEGPKTVEKMTCEIMVEGKSVSLEASSPRVPHYERADKVEFGHYIESEEDPDTKEWVCELAIEYKFRGKNVVATVYSSNFEEYPVGMEITLTPREPKYNYTYY